MPNSSALKSFLFLMAGWLFSGTRADNNSSSLVAAPIALTLMQNSQVENHCYDAFQTVFPAQESPFALWQAQWPPRAAKLIAAEKCFCDDQIPTAEVKHTQKATQWHTELAQYEMLQAQVLTQLQIQATPEALRKHVKNYCATQLKLFKNPNNRPHALSFSPSKALDYSLSLLASHNLLDVVAPFFEYGVKNFNPDLNDWQQLANHERYAAIYGFIQYLKNNHDLNAAAEALKKLTWLAAQEHLPSGFTIKNCYVLAENRHDAFIPLMSSPFIPWFGQLKPEALRILQKQQGAVCRQHFASTAEYEKTVEWDLWQLEISIFERLYAASLELLRGHIDPAKFNATIDELNEFIEQHNFPLRPTEALDYLIGQLIAHEHLNWKIQQLLLIGMANYGDLNEWQGFAETQNWQQVQHLIDEPRITPQPANGFFSENLRNPFMVGSTHLGNNGPSLAG